MSVRILVLAALMMPWTAHAEFVPHVGLGLGQTAERLEVPAGDARSAAERELFSTRLALGVDYPLMDEPLWGGALVGRSTLAFDLLLGPGRWGLVVDQAAGWHRPLGAGFTAQLGLGLSGRLDLERTARSQLDITLPIGVRWRAVEVVWRPAWRMPLGADSTDVFGGARTQQIASGMTWLAFGVHVHVDALAW